MQTTEHPIHLCVDRVVPFELEDEAQRLALEETPANRPASDGDKIAVEWRKLWRPGRTLNIRFLDGSATQRRRVVAHATEWTKHANIRFDFGDHPEAEIRIAFGFAPGQSWSAVGTDALLRQYFPLHEPTMSLGWLKDDTKDAEYARVVLHEFGHALGCIHEHQSPLGGIRWNREAVYAYFGGPPNNWGPEEVDNQVLNKYARSQVKGTTFDPGSIMLYSFPAALVQGGEATRENARLSPGDIRFIGHAYPFNP